MWLVDRWSVSMCHINTSIGAKGVECRYNIGLGIYWPLAWVSGERLGTVASVNRAL